MRRVLVVVVVITTAVAAASDECASVTCRWQGGSKNGSIALIYYAPPTLASGDVGLERAIEILERNSQRRVSWMNTALLEGAVVAYAGELCDFLTARFVHVMVKSNWDYVVDRFVREYLWRADGSACPVSRSLQIAGSFPPPFPAMEFYDLLFYETHWYSRTFLGEYRGISAHAFGVDANDARRRCAAATPRDTWDWVFVGAFADHAGFKRPHRIATRDGRRLAIGKLRDNSPDGPRVSEAARPVVEALESAGVEVRDPVPWDALPDVLAAAKNVLVPDDWRGGGERAVLEARACARSSVVVEPDNPKLQELAAGPLYTTLYYAGQLEAGFLELEARLAARDASTCGLAALAAFPQPDRWCWKSDAFLSRVDLHLDRRDYFFS